MKCGEPIEKFNTSFQVTENQTKIINDNTSSKKKINNQEQDESTFTSNKICPHCGIENSKEANYCGHCMRRIGTCEPIIPQNTDKNQKRFHTGSLRRKFIGILGRISPKINKRILPVENIKRGIDFVIKLLLVPIEHVIGKPWMVRTLGVIIAGAAILLYKSITYFNKFQSLNEFYFYLMIISILVMVAYAKWGVYALLASAVVVVNNFMLNQPAIDSTQQIFLRTTVVLFIPSCLITVCLYYLRKSEEKYLKGIIIMMTSLVIYSLLERYNYAYVKVVDIAFYAMLIGILFVYRSKRTVGEKVLAAVFWISTISTVVINMTLYVSHFSIEKSPLPIRVFWLYILLFIVTTLVVHRNISRDNFARKFAAFGMAFFAVVISREIIDRVNFDSSFYWYELILTGLVTMPFVARLIIKNNILYVVSIGMSLLSLIVACIIPHYESSRLGMYYLLPYPFFVYYVYPLLVILISWIILSDINTIQDSKERIESEKDIMLKNLFLQFAPAKGSESILGAVKNHDSEMLIRCLQHGGMVNEKGVYGETAIMVAAANGDLNTVKLLLENSADPNAQDREGWTALRVSCDKGHDRITALLCKSGADVNFKNKGGWTPLMDSVCKNHIKCVKYLLDNGTDVNHRENAGQTALMLAVDLELDNIVKLLLESGADKNIKNVNGISALSIAEFHKNDEICALLNQTNATQPHVGDVKSKKVTKKCKPAEATRGHQDIAYFQAPSPFSPATCSDDECPCDDVVIHNGEGYVYISPEMVEFRKDCLTNEEFTNKLTMKFGTSLLFGPGVKNTIYPVIMCEQAARKRNLDLAIARKDAKHWWSHNQLPLRVTPKKR